MKLKLIKTKAEHSAALKRIEELFASEADTPERDELDLLVSLVEIYEKENFPVDLPDPIAAIQFRMDQQGLKPKDMVPYIGSQSKVSEVLAGKRSLSLAMIQNLVENFGIPAEVFLRTPTPKASAVDAIAKWKYLDEHLRLRLTTLTSKQFELFFLHFLRSGISLTIEREGRAITKRVISAETYAAGTGRSQKGIDLRLVVEGTGGREEWAFQCKNHKTWSPEQTRAAIQDATQYQAQHYFLVVGCDPHEEVQEEIKKHANWSFWNLDTICAEFRLKVPTTAHAKALFFLPPEELKRFIPFATESLLSPAAFFEKHLGPERTFRHDWKMVGRQQELEALQGFVTGPHKIQVLSAKGGDGKTRLLWELCQTLIVESPMTQVLCLNPYRNTDDFSFAFLGSPPLRLILIDDAHRAEQVPLELLSLVRQDPTAKLLLATRPQGTEALFQKLSECDLAKLMAPSQSLSALKRSETKHLASEVLGPSQSRHADELAELTRNSPFLTVVAGELLRHKRLVWGRWTSNEEFRRQVFVEFEQKNLESVPEIDRLRAKTLLRLLALLAPVQRTSDFIKSAAACLNCSIVEIENLLNRLEQSDLIAGRHDGLRVVPDLFSDFLVYDVCYEPKEKMTAFVEQVLNEFTSRSGALLRNLSEATWIARANGSSDSSLIRPLVEQQYRRFDSSSFYQRAEILRNWSNFSVYLPSETLDLVKRAIELNNAPKDPTESLMGFSHVGMHDHVTAQLPALLKPIAKYHSNFRRAALDIGWELGLARLKDNATRSENHPWSVITETIKFEPKKPLAVTLDALEWLDLNIRKPETLKHLEGKQAVLSLIIGRCFNRAIEWSWSEGRTVHICRQVLTGRSFKITQVIRDRAFEILSWVIENASWLAALDAVEALDGAVKRVVGYDVEGVKDVKALRAEWRPERLKALRLLSAALCKHTNTTVRYKVRQVLKQNIAFEEDSRFQEEARTVVSNITEDLPLRAAVMLLAENSFEFEETITIPFTPEKQEISRKLWDEKLCQTALDLSSQYSNGSALARFLNNLTQDLAAAGFSVFPTKLFLALATLTPALALELAKDFVERDFEPSLILNWNWLLEENPAAPENSRNSLLKKAAESGKHLLVYGAVQTLRWQAKRNKGLTEDERSILTEIAKSPSDDVSLYLLQFVAWSEEELFPWAFHILDKIPVERMGGKFLEPLLQALSPYTDRTIPIPDRLLKKVLKDMVCIPDLGYGNQREWNQLSQRHPLEIYRFLKARVLAASDDNKVAGYQPFTSDVEESLNLSGLAKEPTFYDICADLWDQALSRTNPKHYYWLRLFQMIVLPDPIRWIDKLQEKIMVASNENDLLHLLEVLHFDGSLIVFQHPDVTRSLLARSRLVGGDAFLESMWHHLHSATGPQGRAYSNGVLNPEYDYVESEAVKAAETFGNDDFLGPFFRWIVEQEQNDRVRSKTRADIDMASLD